MQHEMYEISPQVRYKIMYRSIRIGKLKLGSILLAKMVKFTVMIIVLPPLATLSDAHPTQSQIVSTQRSVWKSGRKSLLY